MRNYLLLKSIQWITLISQIKVVINVSYPGIYKSESPIIIPGSHPIENFFIKTNNGYEYQCFETCYPMYEENRVLSEEIELPPPVPPIIEEVSICDELCVLMPDAPECIICVPPTTTSLPLLPPEPSMPTPSVPEIEIPEYIPTLPPLPPPVIITPPILPDNVPSIDLPPIPILDQTILPTILPELEIIVPSVPSISIPEISSPHPEIPLQITTCNDVCEYLPNSFECLQCFCDWCILHPESECDECFPQIQPQLLELPITPSPLPVIEYPIIEDYSFSLCNDYCIFNPYAPECSICFITEEAELPLPPSPLYSDTIDEYPEFHQTNLPTSEIFNFCETYCLNIPYTPDCLLNCFTSKQPQIIDIEDFIPEIQTPPPPPPSPPSSPTTAITQNQMSMELINYECCYNEYCIPLPISGFCPIICYEPCTNAALPITTNDNIDCNTECFNPECPNKCDEIKEINEKYRIQFMIWLKQKLNSIKQKYMEMIEKCIQRTATLYDTELKTIEFEAEIGYDALQQDRFSIDDNQS